MNKIDCEHWSECGVNGGGCCAISKFGNKPSHGVCLTICQLNKKQEYEFPNSNTKNVKEASAPEVNDEGGCTSCKAKGLKRLLKGSAALLKAELGIDAADESTIAKRRATCLACDSYDFGVCNKCGCFCAAKVKLKSEACPQGKW